MSIEIKPRTIISLLRPGGKWRKEEEGKREIWGLHRGDPGDPRCWEAVRGCRRGVQEDSRWWKGGEGKGRGGLGGAEEPFETAVGGGREEKEKGREGKEGKEREGL